MFSLIPFKNKIIVILLIIIILSTSTNIFAAPQFSTERRSLANKAPSNSIKVKYGVSENQIVAPGNPIDVQRPAGTPVGAIDDIGTYQAGQSQVITYTITNPGYLGIAWRVVENFSISAENNVINTSVSPSSLTIPAGGSKDVQINFTPDENGNFSFTFGFEIFYFVDTRIGRIKIPNFIFPSYSFLVSGFSDGNSPTLTINQASGQSDPTNGSPIDFTVVFSEPVTDFTTGDIALSGTAGATTTTVTGSGTTYNVAVSGMTSDGTVIATINAGVAHDSNNNGNDASTSIDNSVIFDSTPPKLISFLRHTPATSPTNADQLVFLATFNEDVQSVDSTDFEVDWSSPTAIAPNITTVSQQTNSTYTITVLGGDLADFNGNVGLNLVATPSITDSLGHSLIDIDPTTADEVYSVDNSPPTLTSFTRDNIPTDKKTNADILEFLVTFSEDVKNVDAADFEINSTPTTTAIIAAVTQAGTASTYTVTISGGDLDDFNGDVGLNLVTTHNITDLLDYVLPSVEPLIDEVYTVDNAGPILTSIMRDTPTSTPTNFDELIFSAIFDEDVTDVDIADFEVDSTSTATIESVTQVTPSTYAVKVSGGDLASFDGTVGIQLTTTLDIKDTLGHSMDYQTAATSEFYLVDNTNAEVSINQANTQVDPTNIEPILFDVLFNEDVIGFVENDVVITGLTGTPTVTVSDASDSDDSTYQVSVSGLADGETVIATIEEDITQDLAGNDNNASTSVDNEVTYDITAIEMNEGSVIIIPQDKTLLHNSNYIERFSILEIHYSEDAYDPPGNEEEDDVTNPNNYILFEEGKNQQFDTDSCTDYSNNSNQVVFDDVHIKTTNVAYNFETYTAIVTFNYGVPLPYGQYRLLVCGTTSITDLAGNPLNEGEDVLIDFGIVEPEINTFELPHTGFAKNQLISLPFQPAHKTYQTTNLTIEVPALSLYSNIVGIGFTVEGWDVTWLNKSVGWLEGSAYPTWEGNTVLTAHVNDPNGYEGPFAKLKTMKYGELVKIHIDELTYIYSVRENIVVSPNKVDKVFQSDGYDWITLLTCEDYNVNTGKFDMRRVVSAVLIEVK